MRNRTLTRCASAEKKNLLPCNLHFWRDLPAGPTALREGDCYRAEHSCTFSPDLIAGAPAGRPFRVAVRSTRFFERRLARAGTRRSRRSNGPSPDVTPASTPGS